MGKHEERKIEREEQDIKEILKKIVRIEEENERILKQILARLTGAQSLVLTIQDSEGNNMGNPATIGATGGLATVQEFSGPGGTGSVVPTVGPIVFASDNVAVATVDPASGAITAVAPGSCNISALDKTNNLTDSVAVTVSLVAGAQSLVLTVTPNAATRR
jgi:hypothetical protein